MSGRPSGAVLFSGSMHSAVTSAYAAFLSPTGRVVKAASASGCGNSVSRVSAPIGHGAGFVDGA
ncbi:hypothetical protein [Nocardiopsis chromatogenes]|uniref:hypothetical protein n=1 Tax=Nocardiopsis chromatogenes TaxID=280239 RepID=UPI001268B071|nr:hypothetical protein [Nocardiopsis chromatogenes]